MIDRGVTAGEQLCNFVNHRFLAGPVWNDLGALLDVTGRSPDLVVFFRQISAVTLTGRIVAAGKSISKQSLPDDPAFRKAFTEHLRDTIGIPDRKSTRLNSS